MTGLYRVTLTFEVAAKDARTAAAIVCFTIGAEQPPARPITVENIRTAELFLIDLSPKKD